MTLQRLEPFVFEASVQSWRVLFVTVLAARRPPWPEKGVWRAQRSGREGREGTEGTEGREAREG